VDGTGGDSGGLDPEQPDPEQPDSAAAMARVLGPCRSVPRWCGWLLITLSVLTLPWIAGIAKILPSRGEAAHYDVSWAGFDAALCLMLLRTGYLALRDQERMGLSAAITGTLLLVDAWFDVLSAASAGELVAALAMALFIELPLAAFCLWIAGQVESERRRRSERLAGLVQRVDGYRGRLRFRSGAGVRPPKPPK